ncbi:TPA: acyltransferase [Vibrio vulnificus]|nr:acyltransferase [Vibrio vulnificus]
MSHYSKKELDSIGFKALGNNVLISKKASIYNAGNISLGSNVRIDDFCVISAGNGGIFIGSNVHIAVYSSLIGAGEINLSDFSNISSKVSIYSSSDDYSGQFMTSPMLPSQYTNVNKAKVNIGKHVIIGCGSVILPGVEIKSGAAVGAMSLVDKDCEEFSIYAGVPARKINNRSRKLVELEKEYLENVRHNDFKD